MNQNIKVGLVLSAQDKMSGVINGAVNKAERKFKGLNNGMTYMKNAIAAIGLYKLSSGLLNAVDAAENVNISNMRLENTFRQMWNGNGSAMKAAKGAEQYANKLQYSIGVGASEIKLVQAKLATFKHLSRELGVVSGLYNRATKAAYDMQATGYGDAVSNATMLGKALEDPLRMASALKKSGTVTAEDVIRIQEVAKTKSRFEAQLEVMKAVEQQVKGNAEKTVKSTDIIKLGLKGIATTIGSVYLPYFKAAANGAKSWIDRVKDLISNNSSLLINITKLGFGVLGIVAAVKVISIAIKGVIFLHKAWSIIAALNSRYLFGLRIQVIALNIWQKIVTVSQWLWNTSLLGCPILWLVGGIALLIAGIVALVKNWDSVTKVAEKVWVWMKKIGNAIKDYVVGRIRALIKGIGLIGSALGNLFSGNFKKAWKDAIEGVNDIYNPTAVISDSKKVTPRNSKQYTYNSATNKKLSRSTTVNYSPTVYVGNGNQSAFKTMLQKHKSDIVGIISKDGNNRKRLSYQSDWQ